MNTPLKIAFLFGAGAEAKKENFDQLVGGDYFNKTVLSPDETVYDALKGKFGGTYFGSCQYSEYFAILAPPVRRIRPVVR